MLNPRLFLVSLVISMLVACGGGGDTTPPTTPPVDNVGGDDGSGGDDDGQGSSVEDPTMPQSPLYTQMSVHDPSVVRDQSGTFYVFGSHLSAAKTDNLMNWTRVADLVTSANPLFDSYEQQAAEGVAWTDGWVGSWAADVIQLNDGKYYFYYNHCAENPSGNCISRSYLGVAVSDSVNGPYQNIQLIMKSGHRAGEGPGIDGNTYNGNIHPNAIDPDVFFDKEGKLWMLYGSYSGGIWILELDPATGLPLEQGTYGTKLTGGYYSAIEGAFMLYSPHTDYYYLFSSYGGFAQNDGYNLRVARAETPNGPFYDAKGQDIIGASGGWESIAPYGNKIMGGFNFKSELGLSGRDYGYMAPGHGSAYYDEEKQQYYMFLHTRFANSGEFHEIRVHQLFVTEDDWLVASPHRYAPIEGDNIVDQQDIVGTYQFINHGTDINRVAKQSSYVELKADGSVSGSITGTYVLEQNMLTISTGANEYKGVAQWQWHDFEDVLVPSFSVQSSQGVNLWGSKMPFVNYQQAIQAIADSIQIPDVVTDDITLPTSGILGATLSWSSSAAEFISANGEVSRPTQGADDAPVTLTATISLNGLSESFEYPVTVRADTGDGLLAHFAFEQSLVDSNAVAENIRVTGQTYTSFNGTIQYSNGVVGEAFELDGATGLRLPSSLLTSHNYTVSYWVYPRAETTHTPTFFAGIDEDSWLSYVPLSWDGNTLLWSNDNGSWFDGATNQKIPLEQWSHMAITVEDGRLTAYIDGVAKFSGDNFPDLFSGNSADILFGINYFDQDSLFEGSVDELRIYDRALSENEVYDLYEQ